MSEAPNTDFEVQIKTLETRLDGEIRKLEIVREVASALGSTLDLDRLLDLILSRLTALLEADRSTLYLVTDDGTELTSKIVQGGEAREIRLRVGEGIAGWVAESGETVNIPDAYADQRFQKDVDRRSGYRTRSILCMPMRTHEGRIVGVVQALNKHLPGRSEPGAFSREDEALVDALSNQAAVAIENAKLYRAVVERNAQLAEATEKLEQKVYELDLLFEVEREMSAAQDVSDILDRLLTRAMDLIGAEAGAIALVQKQTSTLQFSAARGGKAAAIKNRTIAIGSGIVGWVVGEVEPLVVEDPSADPRFHLDLAKAVDYQPRNILCVPLMAEEAPLGAIELCNKIGGPFEASDLKLLTLIAGQASKAIQLGSAKEDRQKETRLASIGQMLSGVLHDLKTPMTIISGYAQLMAETDDKAHRAEYSEQILRQFEQLSSMTREVLAFARGESNMLVRKVYMHKFMEEVATHLRQELQGKGTELVVDTRYKGLAYFDETKLLRVIHNLARNAVQAMQERGGGRFHLTVDTEPGAGGAEAGGRLVFTFADNGPGIPEEVEGRLFEPFVTSGKRDGTGLGLAIVRKIVEEHQGEITVESRRGQGHGTTFVIKLPREKGPTTGEHARP
jgi:signal transduction histidine kinase